VNRLKDCWHLLNLPCEGMSRLASESLDRDLTRAERAALQLHILYCSACRRYLRQLKLVSRALGRLSGRLETDEPLGGPDLPDDVRQEIKRSLRSH
jgi:predicted anti-sigma-YlaC factor YlaD